jgi:dTDP-glucose 4,6-dehydratase
MDILITGARGFIGTHFSMIAEDQNHKVRKLDRDDWDFKRPWMKRRMLPETEYFIHFGANVNARMSVEHPTPFMADNTVGTFNVLELTRKIKPRLFVYISTAEVLGGCDEGQYLPEDAPPRPSNPYACSKAAGELLTYTYFRSYELPAIIVRTQCVWDIDQPDPTKAVPIMRSKILAGEPVAIYKRNGMIGSRQWITVQDFCRRLLSLLPSALVCRTYHIVGKDRNNLEMAQLLATALGRPLKYEDQEISATHELRYAIRNSE